MDDKKLSERTEIERARDWVLAVIVDNPKLRKDHNNCFNGNISSTFLLGDARHMTNPDEFGKRFIKLHDFKTNSLWHENVESEPDSSIVIQGKNLGLASKFFADKGIKNKTTTVGSNDVIVIDLVQDRIVEKLRKIFKENCIPERKIRKSRDFIDPDGECFDKEAARKEITGEFHKLHNRARKSGIGEKEFAEIVKKELSANKQDKGR
jgi:hypothetical protein